MSLLSLTDVHTYYGQSHILHGISLSVEQGEVVSLLGRNGAGKTTTMRSIMGLTQPRKGEIRFDGARIDQSPSHTIAKQGIGFVPEGRRIFTDLTVRDNLEIVASQGTTWSIEDIFELFPILENLVDQYGDELSGGEQQMLAIARALITDPKLLLLDEPSEGLAPIIVDALRENIPKITSSGLTILLTEQNIDFAFEVSDRSYIINKGSIEWDGSIDELERRDDIIGKYISMSEV